MIDLVNAPASLPSSHPLAAGTTASSALIQAYRGVRTDRLPVWFMRQAGRSLPEYRKLREGTTMLEACLEPDLSSRITMQPVERLGVDAAIFFSDIMIPLRLAGVDVDIVPGTGPVLASPVRTSADIDALPAAPGPADADLSESGPLGAVVAGVARTVAQAGHTPLIGFAGAPFTLAAYLVEGKPSKDHLAARTLMHADPATWERLMLWCADVTGAFLRAQIMAGASAGQLFDSWAGSLPRADYVQSVAPASARALSWVRDLVVPDAASAAGAAGTAKPAGTGTDAGSPAGSDATARVPLVHFGVGTGGILTEMRAVGADVIGVDYRTRMDEAIVRLGGRTPVQGNIDPAMLGADWARLEQHVRDVVRRGYAAPAHVVNLGHGVPPTTDPDVLARVVELVHALPAVGGRERAGSDVDIDASTDAGTGRGTAMGTSTNA